MLVSGRNFPRHVNDQPGVNCGGGSLVVSGDDSEHKHGKYFRKYIYRHDRKLNDGKSNKYN
ncbi:hypothetical protein ALC62_13698 [Cyphomyrmex costatus]|uniref:Uncharacterized protein n=1 Tax=Cyphomyrmex costatus TaxID=456900 RepID=A0A195C5Z0_9HYME|nr:hypothetical protein ALC62_13698 [Cyphomyrmex costatus]